MNKPAECFIVVFSSMLTSDVIHCDQSHATAKAGLDDVTGNKEQLRKSSFDFTVLWMVNCWGPGEKYDGNMSNTNVYKIKQLVLLRLPTVYCSISTPSHVLTNTTHFYFCHAGPSHVGLQDTSYKTCIIQWYIIRSNINYINYHIKYIL